MVAPSSDAAASGGVWVQFDPAVGVGSYLEFTIPNLEDRIKEMVEFISSDNFSEVALAWNKLREEVLKDALARIIPYVMKLVKEYLRAECEDILWVAQGTRTATSPLRGTWDMARGAGSWGSRPRLYNTAPPGQRPRRVPSAPARISNIAPSGHKKTCS